MTQASPWLRDTVATMNFYKKLTGTNFKVSGTVVESFEPVRKEFEQFFREGQESRAQLCVYVNQEKVIGEKNSSWIEA